MRHAQQLVYFSKRSKIRIGHERCDKDKFFKKVKQIKSIKTIKTIKTIKQIKFVIVALLMAVVWQGCSKSVEVTSASVVGNWAFTNATTTSKSKNALDNISSVSFFKGSILEFTANGKLNFDGSYVSTYTVASGKLTVKDGFIFGDTNPLPISISGNILTIIETDGTVRYTETFTKR